MEQPYHSAATSTSVGANRQHPETYQLTTPIKSILPGDSYQLKLFILFLLRGIKCGYDFHLAGELDSAKGFDDLVFRKEKNGKYSHLFLEAKHRQDKSSLISSKDLRGIDGDFSLKKYFESYCNIKKNSQFQSGQLKHFVLASNINFNESELKDNDIVLVQADKFGEFNEFLHIKYENLINVDEGHAFEKKSKIENEIQDAIYYKFNIDRTKDFFIDNFTTSYDFESLAKALISCIKEKKQLNFENKIFKIYYEALLSEKIIKIENQAGKKVGKFHDDFVKNMSLTEKALAFRLFFEENKIEISNEVEICVSASDEKNISDKPVSNISLPHRIDDQYVDEFFEHFFFLVNTPNEVDLENLLRDEVGIEFNLKNSDFIFSNILTVIFDWFKKKGKKNEEGTFYSSIDGKQLFEEMRQKVARLMLVGYKEEYINNLPKINDLFNADIVENLLSFLKVNFLSNNNSTILRFTSSNTTLGAIKIRQALIFSDLYQQEDSYIFIQIETLTSTRASGSNHTTISLRDRLSKVFTCKSGILLIVECKRDGLSDEDVDDALKFIRTGLDIENSDNKIILITKTNSRVDRSFEDIYKGRCMSSYDDNKNGFSNFSETSREYLRKHTQVNFQMKKFSSKDVLDDEIFENFNPDDLFKLMNKRCIHIGGKVPKHRGFDEQVYIPRFFNRLPRRCLELLINSGYKNANHNYSETTFSEMDLCKDSEKILLISGEPGMGKSTILSRLANILATTSERPMWIVRIDLNEYSDLIENHKYHNKLNNRDDAIKFLVQHLMRKEELTYFEETLFRESLSEGRTIKIVLIFDGVDEISPNYQSFTIELIKILSTSFASKIMITTRPAMKTFIEKEFRMMAYTLNCFIENDQINFLFKYWSKSVDLSKSEQEYRKYAKRVISEFEDIIHKDGEQPLTRVPLYLKLFADYVSKFDAERNQMPELPPDFDLLDLYDSFVDKVFRSIHLVGTMEMKFKKPHMGKSYAVMYNDFVNKHALLALDNLLSTNVMLSVDYEIIKSRLSSLLSDSINIRDILLKDDESKLRKWKDEIMNENKGIFENVKGGKATFLHRTYIDYFAAFGFVKQIYSKESFCLVIEYINQNSRMSSIFIKNFIKQLKVEISKSRSKFTEEDLNFIFWYTHIKNRDVLRSNVFDFEVEFFALALHAVFNVSGIHKFGEILWYYLLRGNLQRILIIIKEFTQEMKEVFNMSFAGSSLFDIVSNRSSNESERLKILKYLIENDGCATFQEYFGHKNHIMTVLCDAITSIKYGRREIFTYFIDKANFTDELIAQLAIYATSCDQLGLTVLLLQKWNFFAQSTNKDLFDNKKREFLKLVKAHSNSYQKPLDFAIDKHCPVETIKDLLQSEGVDLYRENNKGNGQLHLSVDDANLELIEYLFNKYVTENEANSKDVEASLDLAIGDECNTEIVKFLLQRKRLSLNDKYKNGKSALHKVLEISKNIELVKLALKEKVDINSVNEKLQTPLHFAIGERYPVEIIHLLIESDGIDLTATDENGDTTLHLAVQARNLDVVERLIVRGADINAMNRHNDTALYMAISNGCSVEIVKFLLQIDGINSIAVIESKVVSTALLKAVENGRLQVVKFIAEKDVLYSTICNEIYIRALQIAIEKRNEEVIKCLLEEFSVIVTPTELQTLLHLAIDKECSVKMFKNLLRRENIDLNLKDENGRTILHKSVEGANLILTEYILQAGADVNAKTNNLETPLHLAVDIKCSLEMVKVLLSNDNIELNPRDKVGRTPCCKALQTGNYKVAGYLQENHALHKPIERSESIECLGYSSECEYDSDFE